MRMFAPAVCGCDQSNAVSGGPMPLPQVLGMSVRLTDSLVREVMFHLTMHQAVGLITWSCNRELV
jgi:hypothetical protein